MIDWAETVGFVLKVAALLTTGAIGHRLFYKRKHPLEEIKSWQEVYPALTQHVQEAARKEIQSVEGEWELRVKTAQQQEREDCDEKIKQAEERVQDKMQKEISTIAEKLDTVQSESKRNREIIERAQEQCTGDCFKK